MSNLDNWFQGLLQPLRTSARGTHPPRAVLYAYVKGQLPDTWRVPTPSLHLEDWMLTEVSQHTLTCRDCAQQLALMRQRQLEHGAVWRELWDQLPRSIRTHFTVYIFALFALFTLNVLLVAVLPAPTVSLPCPSLNGAGPVQPGDFQMVDKNPKTEVNKPVKMPSSLSKECAPVPAPRPLWQRWWAGWILLIWTLALGLHVLWEWLISPAPRRTVTASVAIRSIGSAPVLW